MRVTLPAFGSSQSGAGDGQRHNHLSNKSQSVKSAKMVKERFIPPGRSGETSEEPHLCCAVGAGEFWIGGWKRRALQAAVKGLEWRWSLGLGSGVQIYRNVSERKILWTNITEH